MSTSEALHKLKVSELKELLSKNGLLQSGKKEDLIKRLLDNNVSLEAGAGDDEELVDPELEDVPAPVQAASTSVKPPSSSTAAPSATPAQAQPPASTSASAAAPSSTPAPGLTAEQQAMKARAERFGVPFNPNPTPTSREPKAAKPASTSASASASASAPAAKEKEKASVIDKAPVGVSEETLAKRAARFGLPEKKAEEVKSKPTSAAAGTKKEAPKPKEEELSPEAAARRAEDEEKKRKRAEKFGLAKPATNGSSTEEPDAKKVKS